MNRAARISLVSGFFLLIALGLLLQPDVRMATRTSFGRIPQGFGALYDWMLELELPVARSYGPPSLLPATQTVWWIAPRLACDSDPAKADAEESATGPDVEASKRESEDLAAWIQGGGTAVVFLGAEEHEGAACPLLPGVALPARGAASPMTPESVTGTLVPTPRTLECSDLVPFATAEGFEPVAELDEHPFVLERTLGAGRLVLVSDAGFLENGCFGKADAAPLAADLVRRFGTPWLDERAHGLRASRGTFSTLAGSGALPFFLGVAFLGLLHVWRGAAVPPRQLPDSSTPAPSLESFVDSLAALYAGTEDHARVLERYRELTAGRLRRLFGLPTGTPDELLQQHLARRPRLPREGLAALVSTHRTTSRVELEQQVAALDALVREASR